MSTRQKEGAREKERERESERERERGYYDVPRSSTREVYEEDLIRG